MQPERLPRVSAVITAYNCAVLVSEAIESVLAQTYPVHEIVVIDDGSADDIARVVGAYADRGVRIVSQPNQGPSAARNRGIAETTGDFIAFLDCDDMWLQEKTALQVAYLATHPDVALVSGQMWLWDPRRDKRWLGRRGVAAGAEIRRELLIQNVVGNPSGVLLRRSVLEQSGAFDPKRSWGEDWDLWVRISQHAGIAVLDEILMVYRLVPTSLSHQRRWQSIEASHDYARDAIRRYHVAWRRPILLARAYSHWEFARAGYAVQNGFPRHRQVAHAARALLTWPLEDTAKKLAIFLRAATGHRLYQSIRRSMRQAQP